MKDIRLLALITSLVGVGGVVALSTIQGNGGAVDFKANASYTCASVHYGMQDNDLSGYIATYGTTYTEAKSPYESLGYATGITITSFSVTGANAQWLDVGTKYTINKVTYTSDKTHGLKLGTSKNQTNLQYVFDKNVIGCDIYAIGWNDDGITISVNGGASQDVAKNTDISGTFDDKAITYTRYHFDFESTNTLEIATTKRLFIGDIALRVA